jgi:hypothetical protein
MAAKSSWEKRSGRGQPGRMAGPAMIRRTRRANQLRKVADAPQMSISTRHLAILLAVSLLACSLSACGTINEKLAAGLGDVIPQWAGGLPADAPPRPGTAKYDEFMKERERKRLEVAPAKDDAARSDTLEPVH